MNKEQVVMLLEELKADVKLKLENNVQSKITYFNYEENSFTISHYEEAINRKINFIIHVKNKKLLIQNVNKALTISFNHITKDNEKYIVAYYEQYMAINRTIFLLKKFERTVL